MTDPARHGALSLLVAWEERGGYANLLADSERLLAMDARDRAFMTALFYGAVERRLTLDFCIGALAARPASSLDARTRAALRLGLYQLMYMDSVPAHAAVDGTVRLGRDRQERGFLNAVLRAASAHPERLTPPSRERDVLRHISIRESIPLPTVRYFSRRLGLSEAEHLLAAFNRRPPLSLRVNTVRTDRDAVLERFAAEGLSARPDPMAPYGILFDGSVAVPSLPGFAEGHFFVQDTASQLTTELLAPKPGETVLDVCACPGGKSFGAAIAMGNCGRVISRDLHESKLPLIRSGAERLGLSSVETVCADASVPDEALSGAVDRVICDVPCSGLGVIAKKPDLRYRELSSIGELAALSARILASSARAVRSGGTLVFSTCTLTTEENEDTVRAFLGAHPEFTPEEFSLGDLSSEGGCLTLWPHISGTDGFFMAKLRRN